MLNENDVIDQIKTVLDDITNLQAVYTELPNEFTVYPCVYILPTGWESSRADLRDDLVVATFLITILVQLDEDNVPAQSTLKDLAVAVREELLSQSNIRLGGLVDYATITSGQYEFAIKESRLNICRMRYAVNKRYNRYAI